MVIFRQKQLHSPKLTKFKCPLQDRKLTYKIPKPSLKKIR